MIDKNKKILITSALPYANGPIHIGHLVEYIQTDIFVRFLKLAEYDAIYCCADDTHGTPIEINAEKLGISPEELIAKYYKEHTKDFKDFLIEFDSYYTTNPPENKKYSDYFFTKAKEKGYIYEKEVELTYCEHCKRFLPDRYVKGKCPKCGAEGQYGDHCEKCNATYSPTELIDPYCVICGNPPTTRKSKHYFFKLTAFSKELQDWIEKHPLFQDEVKNYILFWIEKGLVDWDITRDAPYFGFNILDEKDKYYYVWLDAPIGYIASTINYCKQKGCSELDYWKGEKSYIVHFIGKDIIYFHFLFWPSMLMAAEFKLPDDIVVHGFLTVNGEKMSKSRGNFITARQFLERGGNPEYLRYYFASLLSKALSDIDLNLSFFKNKINADIIGNFSNFAHRVLSFLYKNFAGKIEEIEIDKEVEEKIHNTATDVYNSYMEINYKQAMQKIMELSDFGNKYFQAKEPWNLIKQNQDKAYQVVVSAFYIVFALIIMLSPIFPKSTKEFAKILNTTITSWNDIYKRFSSLTIDKPYPIFKRIERFDILGKDPVLSLEMRVGEIRNVEDHPKADKLYVIKLFDGKRERQLVAGLKQHYTKEELMGKKVIFLANLKPAVIRKKESEGMLLAVSQGEKVGLLLPPEDANIGDLVEIDSFPKPTEEDFEIITIEQFKKVKLEGKSGKVVYRTHILKVENSPIKIDKNLEGLVS